MQELGLKISWKDLTISEGLFCQVFLEYRVPHSWFSPWTPFRAVESQQLQLPWFNLCRCRWQVSIFSWQSPFLLINLTTTLGEHFRTILSHGAENVHSQVWQRFCWPATQCTITGLGHKTVPKILWTTCLTSLLVQENIPSCCFSPYLELHCYHHPCHRELYIILSEASVTHLAV